MNIKIALSVIMTVWAIFLVCSAKSPQASALAVDEVCSDVQIVFARGSGQGPGEGEYQRFIEKISETINQSIVTVRSYELGTESYGSFKYPAVSVADVSNGNAVGAKLSAGMANDYGESVKQGVNELHLYMLKRVTKCPNIKFILGGYSQGAQVMGQAMIDMPERVRPNIVFTGLFGDPKLYLPEGEGINPPACRGKDYSPWRRVVEECATDNGSLSARKPYLPVYALPSTGLWCNAHDFVCGSSKFAWDKEGHGTYAKHGGAIDEAANEAAMRLRATLPPSNQYAVFVNQMYASAKYGLDLVIVADFNMSDTSRAAEMKAAIGESLDRVAQLGGRMALTLYSSDSYGNGNYSIQQNAMDTGYGFVSAPQQTLTRLDAWQPVPLSGGGDTFYYIATAETIDFLDWGSGRAKAIVLLTERDLSSADQVHHDLREYIRRRALEIDPVNVYPVVTSEHEAGAAAFADATGGRAYTFDIAAGSLAGALESVTTELIERPVVIFSNTEYLAKPGETVRFDVSRSYAYDSSIDAYDWDFNGDGVWDRQTSEPFAEYVYEAAYDGLVHARAHAANGMMGTMTAEVKVAYDDAATVVTPPSPTGVNAAEQGDGSEVLLSWERAADASDQLVSIDGVTIGRLTHDVRSITIEDLDRTQGVTIGVRSIDQNGAVSEESGVVLAAISTPEEPGAETSPPDGGADPVPTAPDTPTPGEFDREARDDSRRNTVMLASAKHMLMTYGFMPQGTNAGGENLFATLPPPFASQSQDNEVATDVRTAHVMPDWAAAVAIAVTVASMALARIVYNLFHPRG